MEKKCLFCTIVKPFEIALETINWKVVWDVHPVNPGHLIAFPKSHIVSVFDIPNSAWEEFPNLIKQMRRLVVESNIREVYTLLSTKDITSRSNIWMAGMLDHPNIDLIPTDFTIGWNEGRVAGRTIDHVHLQFIPRFEGGVADPVGGIRGVIPVQANYTK